MLFRRHPKSFVDLTHRHPIIETKPDAYTSAPDRCWTYHQICCTYHATFALGQIVRLEDQSKFHQIFTGRVSEVVEHYKDVFVVHVTPLDYEPTNPLAPPPVRLTLSTHVLSLPKHLRFLRWCKKRTKCLRKFKATEPDAIMRSLDDFQKQLDGMDSFGNSVVEFGSEILVRSSQDRRYDEILSLVRGLDPLPDFF
jgi:hypothetical protein